MYGHKLCSSKSGAQRRTDLLLDLIMVLVSPFLASFVFCKASIRWDGYWQEAVAIYGEQSSPHLTPVFRTLNEDGKHIHAFPIYT